MGRFANFIDGAYLQNLLAAFGKPKVDFEKLAIHMAAGCERLRTYYYDCMPYQSNPPTAEEAERFGKKQRFIAALGHYSRLQPRLGRLERRGERGDGTPIFQQKRVDILLGVDLAILAAKHQITDAAILAGDSDFLPAIEAAKPEGVVIHLFHGANAHRDLLQAADECTPIDEGFIAAIKA
ncbi:NYN domain-containing protein [Humisphaera borealis]|uniref:NYN domain-containing protein n=1 Tax=Humisphaera borealis TaxID=2807512 RepID=UPI0019D0EF8B|nr:NYN domain-containing protein [Humisphaera borealis]